MTTSTRMRIVLVDDHVAVRKQLRQLFELRDGFEVVGEGSDWAEALEAVDAQHPDVVVMDMRMPGMSGMDATRLIKQRWPEVRVLALTAFDDPSQVAGMVEAGADGYLLKGAPADELVAALQAVASGNTALTRTVAREIFDDFAELHRRDRLRVVELAELDRMKAQFASVVSHELRTPLTSIKGAVDTMERGWGVLDEDLKLELLGAMRKQVHRLTQLVTQILTVSGIERGGLGLVPATFSLGEVARKAVASVDAPGREISVAAPDVTATGDRERIEEVAIALLENALKFTGGPVSVIVTSDGEEVGLEVRDHGPGIPPETLEKLMLGPFVQADSSNTRPVGGLGLSLYIARQVLDASGGRLEIDTAAGRGSSFVMVLPRAEAR